jgi:hypothetical protein
VRLLRAVQEVHGKYVDPSAEAVTGCYHRRASETRDKELRPQNQEEASKDSQPIGRAQHNVMVTHRQHWTRVQDENKE